LVAALRYLVAVLRYLVAVLVAVLDYLAAVLSYLPWSLGYSCKLGKTKLGDTSTFGAQRFGASAIQVPPTFGLQQTGLERLALSIGVLIGFSCLELGRNV
jgi:hypothetical protein